MQNCNVVSVVVFLKEYFKHHFLVTNENAVSTNVCFCVEIYDLPLYCVRCIHMQNCNVVSVVVFLKEYFKHHFLVTNENAVSTNVCFCVEIYDFSLAFYVLLTIHNGHL